LPHILVQPNAPPNAASGSAAESDGIDDWFIPEDDGFPNDWIYPDNHDAPASAAWKPGYMRPFLQGKVGDKFQIQVRKYQTIDPRVKFIFSEQPPPWVVRALEQVGGTYIVDP
jgi:hypothetical protein